MFNLTVDNHKETIRMSDEEIADRQHAIDLFLDDWDHQLETLRRLGELDKLCKDGKSDIASEVAGIPVSSESLNVMMKASVEDFWSTTANATMAAGDLVTLGMAGTVKKVLDITNETTTQLRLKFDENRRRLKGYKIQDSDVANARAANLKPFAKWMFCADIVMKIHAEFQKITAQNAFGQMKKIAELCNQIGWKPRGLLKWTGIPFKSTKEEFRERWSVTSDKAGKLGWNAANLQKAIAICEKLLNLRVQDFDVDVNVLQKAAELGKGGLNRQQLTKTVSGVTVAACHEIGKMVRVVNKLLSKIEP